MNTSRIRAAAAAAAVVLVAVTLTGCDGGSSAPSAQEQGQADTEQAFKQQSAAVPYPKALLTDSLERRNLRERLIRTNKPNAIGYVYVFPPMGDRPIGYYVIKGKISSVQSQMTTDQLIQGDCYHGCAVVNAPGDDGSYGANEGGADGVFFFTVEGAMVTTNLKFMHSDQPLPVDVPKLNPKP